jgi:molybdate transport system substrate-binding protein
MTLRVLAAGASRGLVGRLAPRLRTAAGPELDAHFTAAQAIFASAMADSRCDLVILTQALMERLAGAGKLASPIRPIGIARTGIGVAANRPDGARPPPIDTPAALRATLRAASAVYMPDPELSTAGAHLMRTLDALGIAAVLAPGLRPFPNGAAAMRALAADALPGALGCTQITEIIETPGLEVVGPLPPPHGLATLYAAAVHANAAAPEAAHRLLTMLTGPDTAALRAGEGFEHPAPS